MHDLIIIGGGIGGAAAALRAAQYNLDGLWLLGDRHTARKSRGKWVMNIDNMVGINANIILDRVRDHFATPLPHLEAHIGTQDLVDNTLQRLDAYPNLGRLAVAATALRQTDEGFVVEAGDDAYRAKSVVLATGVMDRQPFIAKERGGKVRDMPNWVYPFANRESFLYCIRCEGHLTREGLVVVIGHGEAAAQVALMTAERYGSVAAILTNGETPDFTEDSRRLLAHYGVAIRQERIVDLEGPDYAPKGELRQVTLEGGEVLEVRFALVSLGLYRVYNDLARAVGAELAAGDEPPDERRVLINHRGETTVRGLFAVGDMALRADEAVMMQVYTAQEYAVRAVDTIDWRRRRVLRQAILG